MIRTLFVDDETAVLEGMENRLSAAPSALEDVLRIRRACGASTAG